MEKITNKISENNIQCDPYKKKPAQKDIFGKIYTEKLTHKVIK